MTPAPRTGTEFAGYRIEGLVARGGMGAVYRAQHPRLGATIALKVMDPELATDEVFRERFVREARVASRVTHPHIVPIYDAGEWDGDLYIAMRYIEGDDLRSLLRKSGPLSVQQTSEIGFQVASAIDAAHRAGMIHRDVKPANILVAHATEGEVEPIAYLADLGLTKHVDSHTGVTESGALLGTIDYIAPEQISGEGVDGRADIYSLACVLFECLTGTVPYARENQAAVLWAHLHEGVPRATSLNPTLPPHVDDVLSRGMAKSPDDRFSTARDLVSALRTVREAGTVVAPPPADAQRTRASSDEVSAPAPPPAKRRGRLSAPVLAAALGLILGGVAVAAAAALLRDDGTTAAPPATTERSSTTTSPADSGAFTPFDEALLQYVPDELRPTCRHREPLTSDFSATVACRPGGPVSSLTYSHARSSFLLQRFFESGMASAGLPPSPPGGAPDPIGNCGTGEIPAINMTVALGLSGRMAMSEWVMGEERLGLVRCYRRGGLAHIDWKTSELGIYAAAKGKDLQALYDWWRREAGPEP